MQKSKQVYSDMVKHELQVESLKARVEIQTWELESTSYEFESTSSRIKNSMKTQLNRVLKSSSFPKIISPTLFGSS